MIYRVIIEKNALEDIRSIIKSGKKSDIRKLDLMLEELKTNPYQGAGKPEQLKHQLAGFWSRRINKKDRLIYQVFETPDQKVVIISALGHY